MSGREEKNLTKEEYNSIPVHYCAHCLSLSIRRVAGLDAVVYCDKCGNAVTKKASIEEWQKLYKDYYGHDFLTEK